MRRNTDSKYLITRLFSKDYFRYYSNPAIFSAYFFPYVAIGETRPYSEDEFDEKLSNVRNNLHGNFHNYASQGFGNVIFDKTLITFSYFYERLSKYENDKYKYFKKKDGVEGDLEAESTKRDIHNALNKKGLMLKRNMEVPEEIRKELIGDLDNHEVKYVLAKILYYIVDDSHMLPNVDMNYYESITEQLNLYKNKPNVYLTFRKETDIDRAKLSEILLKAKEIQLLCHDGASLFGNNEAYRDCESKEELFLNCLTASEKFNIEVIVQYSSDRDMNDFNNSLKHLRISKSKLAEHSIKCIKNMMCKLNDNRVSVKVTDQNLPYAVMIFKFEDASLDFLKLDLYSPLINDNIERPSMYIFKRIDSKMFDHFQNVFEKIWGDERYSKFI